MRLSITLAVLACVRLIVAVASYDEYRDADVGQSGYLWVHIVLDLEIMLISKGRTIIWTQMLWTQLVLDCFGKYRSTTWSR